MPSTWKAGVITAIVVSSWFVTACGGRLQIEDDAEPTSADAEDAGRRQAPAPSTSTDCKPGFAWPSQKDTTCVPCDPGMYCPGGRRAREYCGYTTWDDDGDPVTPCAAKTDCAAGTHVVSDGERTTDRTCEACTPGSYTTETNTQTCLPGDACPAGTVLLADAPSTFEAPTCSPCSAGTYCSGVKGDSEVACASGTWDHDGTAATPCVAWTTCQPGEHVVQADGTALTDRKCAPCEGDSFSSAPMATSCTTRTTCAAGSYVSVPAGPASDRQCAACPSGTASTTVNAITCAGVRGIYAAESTTCAVTQNGAVACWGAAATSNTTTVSVSTPALVPGITDAVAVAPASDHACAIRADGTVVCWGANDVNQLGDGTTAFASAPVQVQGLVDVLQIGATGTFNYARTRDGSVYKWGYEDLFWDWAQYATPTAYPEVSPSSDLSVGDEGFCSQRSGGILRCASVEGAVDDVVLSNVVKTIAGPQRCALRTSGGVTCWAANASPYDVPGVTGATDLVGSRNHQCVLVGGQVQCWGYNDHGQLGDGTTTDRATVLAVPGLDGVTALAAGDRHTCALRVNGEVYCWGENTYGQVGDGMQATHTTPTRVLGL